MLLQDFFSRQFPLYRLPNKRLACTTSAVTREATYSQPTIKKDDHWSTYE